MQVVSFIPIKLKNQRLPGKNLLPLQGKPLCQHLFSTISGVKNIDSKYVYCSDEEIKPYLTATPDLQFLKRDPRLDGPEIKGLEIIRCFVRDVDADIYVLSHVTSPFIKAESIYKAIEIVKSGQYDSAFSAKKIQQYCWCRNTPVNYNPSDIVITQNVEPVYVETGGFFIFRKEVFTNLGRRIGIHPYLYELDEKEGVDIDTAEDFAMAEYFAAAR